MNNNYVHHTPRRLRVRILALKGNVKAAQELQTSLLEVSGEASVEINLLTGSVLVQYDGERHTFERVRGYMRSRRLSPSGDRTDQRLLTLRAGIPSVCWESR